MGPTFFYVLRGQHCHFATQSRIGSFRVSVRKRAPSDVFDAVLVRIAVEIERRRAIDRKRSCALAISISWFNEDFISIHCPILNRFWVAKLPARDAIEVVSMRLCSDDFVSETQHHIACQYGSSRELDRVPPR
jgi:hypothetical protein